MRNKLKQVKSKSNFEDCTDFISAKPRSTNLDMKLSKKVAENFSSPLPASKEIELIQENQEASTEIPISEIQQNTFSRDEEPEFKDYDVRVHKSKANSDINDEILEVFSESEVTSLGRNTQKTRSGAEEIATTENNSDLQTPSVESSITVTDIDRSIERKTAQRSSKQGLMRMFTALIFFELALRTIFTFTVRYEDPYPSAINTIFIVGLRLMAGISCLGKAFIGIHAYRPNAHFMSNLKWVSTERVKFKPRSAH